MLNSNPLNTTSPFRYSRDGLILNSNPLNTTSLFRYSRDGFMLSSNPLNTISPFRYSRDGFMLNSNPLNTTSPFSYSRETTIRNLSLTFMIPCNYKLVLSLQNHWISHLKTKNKNKLWNRHIRLSSRLLNIIFKFFYFQGGGL